MSRLHRRMFAVVVSFVGVLCLSAALAAQNTPAPPPTAQDPSASLGAGEPLFDFEDEADVKAWSNLDVYAVRETEAKAAYEAAAKTAADPAKASAYKPLVQPAKEPPVKIEWTAEGASSGKHAMKLTFAGGRMPTVATKPTADDWRAFRGFRATVTAPRTCLVVFRVMTENGRYGTSYNDGVSRWEFAARCEAGKNTLATRPPQNAPAFWSKIKSFEIYMYHLREGESIIVDGIGPTPDRPEELSPFRDAVGIPAGKYFVPAGKYKVLGTDLDVKDVDELADRLKDKWVKPEDMTPEQIEAGVRAEYEKLKQDHPKAVLVTLRDGQKGFDPADPEKPFAGWEDAGTPSHLPMGLTLACFTNSGRDDRIETCFRNRPGFLRVDLSSLPKDARILAARLIVARGLNMGNNWETKPTMFVVEPCNRPWKEYEVNVFEYAKDRFWGDYAGETWGDDADCTAVFLAHGPSGGKACSLDFADAVRFWTDGKHANQGFILYGSPKYVDYLNISTRECATIANRPAVMVVYEPKP